MRPSFVGGVRVVLAAVLSAAALGAVPAGAATVALHEAAPGAGFDELVYRAAPGERNDVVLEERLAASLATASMTVRDPGAVVVPRGSCRSVDEHTAVCVPRRDALGEEAVLLGMRVRLGDGDDGLTVVPTPANGLDVVANGGAGDDVLRAGRGTARLAGGVGNDLLVGGPSFDRLDGGGGIDALYGGAHQDFLSDGDRDGLPADRGPGPDILDGGRGASDTVSYRQRTEPVSVRLDDGRTDGRAGEGDVIVKVEGIEGGRGADHLVGDHRANVIAGRGGEDRLAGRRGADVFRLAGGTVACGADRDLVHSVKPHEPDTVPAYLRPDCEAVADTHRAVRLWAYPERIGDDTVTYRVRCPGVLPETNTSPDCGGRLRLAEAGGARGLLAAVALPRRPWRGEPADARLTRRGRRLVSRGDGVRAIVAIGGDEFPLLRWTIQLATRDRR